MPTLRRSRHLCAAIALAALTASCDKGPTAPVAPPSPPRPPQNDARLSVSGVVYEHTAAGAGPKAGVRVDVSPVGGGPSSSVTSDIAGRYEVSVAYESVAANVWGEFSQPCRASITVTGDAVLDVHIVPNTGLSATRLPPTLPIPGPTLSGTVFERTGEGSRPVPGVTVYLVYDEYDGWHVDIGGHFVTDSDGRFFFCDLKFGEALAGMLSVRAFAPGFRDVIGWPVREPGVLDIEMIRR